MNSYDILNLQEAYLEIYEGKGSRGETPEDVRKLATYIAKRAKRNPQNTNKYWSGVLRLTNRAPHGSEVIDTAKREFIKKEEVDIYDVVLSHLLDEGYADTEKAAEAIMANMSEEWRDSIVEATAAAKRGIPEPHRSQAHLSMERESAARQMQTPQGRRYLQRQSEHRRQKPKPVAMSGTKSPEVAAKERDASVEAANRRGVTRKQAALSAAIRKFEDG